MRNILNRLSQLHELVSFYCQVASNGRNTRLTLRALCSFAVTAADISGNTGQIGIQPIPALTKRLLMSTNNRYVGQFLRSTCDQMMYDRQLNLTNDLKRRLQEAIEGLTHHTLGRVLDRYHGHIAGAIFCQSKDISDGGLGFKNGGLPEVF